MSYRARCQGHKERTLGGKPYAGRWFERGRRGRRAYHKNALRRFAGMLPNVTAILKNWTPPAYRRGRPPNVKKVTPELIEFVAEQIWNE